VKQQFKQFKQLHNHSDSKQEPLSLTQIQANSTFVESHETLPLHYQLEARKGLQPEQGKISTFLYKILSSLPRPIQLLVIAILKRANDPKPEEYSSDQRKDGIKNTSWGWLPLLTLISALGMLSIAYAFIDSRAGGTGLRAFVYPGLFLIFAPTGLRLLSPSASRTERIGLLCVAGCCCYFIKVMGSPLYFSFYDEFLHWRTADDIVKSGHLFTENALLPVSPYYPGLEIVTNALGTISGLDTFNSGLIVVGIARLLMMLTLFALNEQVLRSARMASIATLLYMTNPHFLLFDSQFAYESLALPLATFIMFAMAPHQWVSARLARLGPMTPFVKFAKVSHEGLRSDLRWITFSAWLVLIAVVLTHHVTDFILDALLVLWAIIYALLRLTPIHQSKLARTALLGVLMSIVWIGLKGNPVVGYISLFLGNVFNELGHVLAGTSSSRQLFATNVMGKNHSSPFCGPYFVVSSIWLALSLATLPL
jgi:hypothetical protein